MNIFLCITYAGARDFLSIHTCLCSLLPIVNEKQGDSPSKSITVIREPSPVLIGLLQSVKQIFTAALMQIHHCFGCALCVVTNIL